MGFSPLALLGQALSASGMHPDPDDEEGQKLSRDGITVQASPQTDAPDDTAEVPLTKPKSVFSDRSKLAAPTREQMKEVVPRQGMFGVKGTLRDVLGVLGDSMLMASGKNPYYRGIRQSEKAGDARFGMTAGPAARREAIERTAQIDPDAADKMMTAYDNDQYRQDNLASQDAARKALTADRDFTNANQALALSQQYFRGAGDDPAKQAIAKQYSLTALRRAGAPQEMIDEVENMTPEQASVYARGGITVTGQEVDHDRDATREQRERLFNKAEAGRMKRDNPPAPRQARSQTELEYFQQVDRIPEGKRTEGQKAFYKKYTKTGKSSALEDMLSGGPKKATTSPSRFQVKRIQ